MKPINRLLLTLAAAAIILLSVFFWSIVQAAPFLVCDPQENITSYIVDLDGVIIEEPALGLGDGTVRLYYDLGGIADGVHNCTVTAKNVWGVAEPTPFSFSKIQPESPSVLDISAQ